MNALFQLIAHEYRKYVFTRGFLIFLLILPASGLFGLFAASINDRAAPQRTFTVVDATGELLPVIDAALAMDRIEASIRAWDSYTQVMLTDTARSQLPDPFAPARISSDRRAAFEAAGGLDAAFSLIEDDLPEGAVPPSAPRDRFRLIPQELFLQDGDASIDAATEALLPYLRGEKTVAGETRPLFAALLIPEDFADGGAVQYWSDNLVDTDLRNFLDYTLTRELRNFAFDELGIERAEVDRIRDFAVPVRVFTPTEEGGEADATDIARTVVPLVLAYALLLVITSIGGMLLTSTVEEKSNKIVEVLLSSVSATQLMLGKLIGLALVGMTLPAIVFGLGFLTVQVTGAGAVSDGLRDALFGSPLVPVFFFYFVVGYLLFASIYLAVGAMSNTIQDAQSFLGPLTIMMLLPVPFLQLIVQDPNGLVARIFTWIPIYTPYAVLMRISANPPLWEIIGATALLLVVVGIVLTAMGRIYRNGVLSSGGAPSLRKVRELSRTRG